MTNAEKYKLIAAELRERAAFPSLRAQREHILALAVHFENCAAEGEPTQHLDFRSTNRTHGTAPGNR
jgi:hypothetical protein